MRPSEFWGKLTKDEGNSAPYGFFTVEYCLFTKKVQVLKKTFNGGNSGHIPNEQLFLIVDSPGDNGGTCKLVIVSETNTWRGYVFIVWGRHSAGLGAVLAQSLVIPCKFMVQVVLLPLSSTTTLVAAMTDVCVATGRTHDAPALFCYSRTWLLGSHFHALLPARSHDRCKSLCW